MRTAHPQPASTARGANTARGASSAAAGPPAAVPAFALALLAAVAALYWCARRARASLSKRGDH